MGKILLLLLALLPAVARANEDVALGLTYDRSGYVGARVGSYNFWDSKEDEYRFAHYGYGGGALEVGNGLALNVSGSSGLIMFEVPDMKKFSPIMGFDLGGKINFNTNSAVHSFYHWLPAMTIGPEVKLPWGRIVVLGKEGVAVGNYDMPNLIPAFRFSQGVGVYVNTETLCVGADYTVFGDNQVGSADINLNLSKSVKLDLRVEQWQNTNLGLKDQSASLSWKSDLIP